jgi:hypothetical protein
MKKREKLNVIHQYYPQAVTTIDSVNKLIDFIEAELDLEPTQVMLADSICSDDVNSIQYPARAHELLGPFKMGGLDGFPFTGLTGMGAFASHVPDEGAVFVYYHSRQVKFLSIDNGVFLLFFFCSFLAVFINNSSICCRIWTNFLCPF